MSIPPIKLSFGLKKTTIGSLPAKKKIISKPAFSFSADDDEPLVAPPVASTSTLAKSKLSTVSLSRQQKLKQAADLKLDSTVYEYDEVYDNMKEGSRMAEAAKKKDSGERKPQYIAKLIETAEIRKIDRIRAEDKMIQHERQKEGEEFKDKDQFVTPSYLAQQEELRKTEAEEKKKEAASRGKTLGMSSFYKEYLDATSKAHEAAVAASLTKSTSSTSDPSFKLSAPLPQSEAQQAASFEAKTGKKLEVNDDGIIIDKREMLSGGLNVIPRTKMGPSRGGFSAPIAAREAAKSDADSAASNAAPGLTAAERGRQSRERHSREIERQMVEMEKKRKREEEEEKSTVGVKIVRRNDETKVEELKRKAEERRRKREEDEKKAAAEES